MASKEIFAFLSIFPEPGDPVHTEIQSGNIFFREVTRQRTIQFWDTNSGGSSPVLRLQPWKCATLMDDDDPLVGHAPVGSQGRYTAYPSTPGSPTLGTYVYSKYRSTGVATSIPSSEISRVIGAVGGFNNLLAETWQAQNSLISLNDVPLEYTQIGTVFPHPQHAGGSDISTVAGASYITFANSHYLDNVYHCAGGQNLLTIGSGADAGVYFVRFVDFTNNRAYLANLDGSVFVGQATASSLPWYSGPGRRAYFNEVSVIQLSTGLVNVGGSFRPGATRSSFILKVWFDKTGSDASAAGAEQQGSYYISMKPYTHGDGVTNPQYSQTDGYDLARIGDNGLHCIGGTTPFGFNFFEGGVAGMVLDETNQRTWFGYTNTAGNSGIGYWRFRTNEGFREIANYLGTGAHSSFVTPAITLAAGDLIRDMQIGPTSIVYTLIGHASGGNAGIAIINPDLTTTQYGLGGGFPSFDAGGSVLDSSRSRTGTAADTSTNGADQVTSASGAFTSADIGRAIKLTGLGADSGTYLIATIVGGTQVTVTTMAGAGVTFTTQSGGTFQIAERLYLFFKNNTTGAGKINYMETLVPGTFLTRTVSMTNGANLNIPPRIGAPCEVSIDPVNGNIYWLSNDTQQQINKYDVAANSHSFRTIANVQTPAGGTGTIGTITLFTSILVNPKFDEIWVGTDQGIVKLVKSDFAGSNYKRYFGPESGTYANPAGLFRPQGTFGTEYRAVALSLRPDGGVSVWNISASSTMYQGDYSREADLWNFKETWDLYAAGQDFYTPRIVFDSVGNYLYLFPIARLYPTSQSEICVGSVEVQYQWDTANSKWIPLQVAQGALPNKSSADTISPGCRSKPVHAALEDVLYGVKIGFTKQGGATPANNEFLGRMAQTSASKTDGATTSGGANFDGSGFVSGDVGRYLRIETGADAGVYKITVFNSSTSITVARLNSTAFSAGATASSLNYTIWSRGTAGSNAGPETATVLLSNGFGKDNTQEVSGITYDTFHFKTLLEEQVEGTKFCVPSGIGAHGATDMKVYYDYFPRVASAVVASHNLQTTHIRALPGAEWNSGGFDGRKLIDGFVDAVMDNAGSRGTMSMSPDNANIWYGTVAGSYGFLNPVSSALGACPMVDLGVDAEVGYVIVRVAQSSGNETLAYSSTYHGLKATLYKANGPTAPVASSTSRTSGVGNLSLTVNNATISVVSGDFLGAITTGPLSDGSAVAGQNVFQAPAATFVPGDVGKILKVTSVGDVGSYRIVAVDGTGAFATVTNLDQTAKAWLISVSSIVYEVRNGVREEDVLCVPSIGAPTQRLCIERLLSPTQASVRVPPHTTAASQNWECAIPTWDKVKRVSMSTEALPPEVKNNGTWVCADGRDQFDTADSKIFMDLTNLPTAQRTGRWWQLQMMPRGVNAVSQSANFCTFEFYSPSGARIGFSPYTFTDNALNNADFLSSHINRIDFIQSSYLAMNAAGFNGLVAVGGANGDTLTLGGGSDKFMGFQTRRPLTDGVCVAGLGGNFTSATAAFLTSDVGRFLRITAGANAGIYRIATRASATAVTLTLPSGTVAPSFTATSGETFIIHEGIAVGGATPDRIVFLDDLTREYTLASINDAMTSITINEGAQPAMSGKQWEIRRPAFDTASATVDSSKRARLVRPGTTYPVQTGDIAHDSKGALRFFVDDIGTGNQRSDGSIVGGDQVFTGSGFCHDDVGRYLLISSGVAANQGFWRITDYTTSTSIKVANPFTGVDALFTADAAADKVYKVIGDRRFKVTKQVTTLRA